MTQYRYEPKTQNFKLKTSYMLRNYLKIFWRNLTKHKVFSFINIFGLASGMTVCMLAMIKIKEKMLMTTILFIQTQLTQYTMKPLIKSGLLIIVAISAAFQIQAQILKPDLQNLILWNAVNRSA